jgi:hypothetical protein
MIIFLIPTSFLLIAMLLVPSRALRNWSYLSILLLISLANIGLTFITAGNNLLSLVINSFFVFAYAFAFEIFSRAWLRQRFRNILFAAPGMVLVIFMGFAEILLDLVPTVFVPANIVLLVAVNKIWQISATRPGCSARQQMVMRTLAILACCPMVVHFTARIAPQDNFLFPYEPLCSTQELITGLNVLLFMLACGIYFFKPITRRVSKPMIDQKVFKV